MPDRVIGLDIGASSVKASQVLRNGDGTFVVEHQAARPLPRGAVSDGRIGAKDRGRVVETIRQMIDSEPFGTKDVIIGLNSSSAVFMQEMFVPVALPQDIAKSLPLTIEAQDSSLNPRDNEISWTVTGTVETDKGPRLRVLIYTARSDYAESIARAVEAAGLNVVGADLNALAVLRTLELQDRPSHVVDAVLDIGANIASLLIHHNGVPSLLVLDPDSAGHMASARIADALGLDSDDEQAEWEKVNNQEEHGVIATARRDYSSSLAAKISGAFTNYIKRSPEHDQFATLTLVGGGAHLADIGRYLHSALGSVHLQYPLIATNIHGGVDRPADHQEVGSGGDYLVSVGLAMGDRL